VRQPRGVAIVSGETGVANPFIGSDRRPAPKLGVLGGKLAPKRPQLPIPARPGYRRLLRTQSASMRECPLGVISHWTLEVALAVKDRPYLRITRRPVSVAALTPKRSRTSARTRVPACHGCARRAKRNRQRVRSCALPDAKAGAEIAFHGGISPSALRPRLDVSGGRRHSLSEQRPRAAAAPVTRAGRRSGRAGARDDERACRES
jgi:hypothetical protein